ncbi:MAG: SpoIIIAH-like family protein [Eubacteriales bacterium]
MKKGAGRKLLSKMSKRNLIIISVVLLIGVAVYLNYLWFYDPIKDVGYGEQNGDDNNQAGNNETDYFAAAALSREQARDAALEVLQEAVDTAGSEGDTEATLAEMARIAANIEDEANIEALVMSKGFDKCVAVINGDKIDIIVNAAEEGLLATEVAQICAIVYEQAGIRPDKITINPR